MASILQWRQIARLYAHNDSDYGMETLAPEPSPSNDVVVVDVKDNEKALNPRLWPLSKRIICTAIVSMVGFVVSWAGSITSSAAKPASEEFGVSETVESLATGLYFIGFGLGSLVAGPISETFGRNLIYTVALIFFMIFIAAAGAAPNIETQCIFRFLAGFFGNTPLTCAGGSLADMWSPDERVLVVPVYSVFIFDGSTLAPVVGGWITQGAIEGSLSWRWVEWTTLIISAVTFALVLAFLPETYAPVLAQWKAHHIRARTGDQRYRAPIEVAQEPLLKRLKPALSRPFVFLAKEPIVMAVALYLILVYVILFTFLNGFSFIFGKTYGWAAGLTGTAFVAITIGQHLPLLLLPLTRRWAAKYKAHRKASGEEEIDPPENRLWMAMVGALALPVSLFWLGWTSVPSISPWSGLAAGVLFGFSCVAIYIGFYMYMIDAYATYAASGLASTTVLRYVFAGAMLPPSIPMYANLGNQWTLTLFGAMAVVLGFVPFVFFCCGSSLRAKSSFARELTR